MKLRERLESLGGTVVPLTVDGIDYFAVGFRASGEVDVYNIEGELIANVTFHDDTECATITVNGEQSNQPNLYFEHSSKMEYDMAADAGRYLAAISS